MNYSKRVNPKIKKFALKVEDGASSFEDEEFQNNIKNLALHLKSFHETFK